MGLFDCFGDTFMVLVCQIKRKKTSEESDVEVDDKVKNGIKTISPQWFDRFSSQPDLL